ncbi:Pectin lyase fold/virulence factor [Pseudocohnilembus persalinus]|uniref:Pectin lyase fold/virulence factor n=1 Tax=Pseudocohnilembus persalinus TaxID=266149 RepID=A0A0V0R856_PSEPJ|nr:Pectin lyase fold/virulence factor [Pseudocohnilembus persalinus]|eukprot:KRX10671.1 Pectin lyase fold/virulence factor [Pseudocohnilembus persalinus]
MLIKRLNLLSIFLIFLSHLISSFQFLNLQTQENVYFYIACNPDVSSAYSGQVNFESSTSKFELDSSYCQNLEQNSRLNVKVGIFLVQQDGELNETEDICDLSEFVIDFTGCTLGQYFVAFEGIQMDSNNNTISNQKISVQSYDKFLVSGFAGLEVKNLLIIEQLVQMNYLKVGELSFVDCKMMKSSISEDPTQYVRGSDFFWLQNYIGIDSTNLGLFIVEKSTNVLIENGYFEGNQHKLYGGTFNFIDVANVTIFNCYFKDGWAGNYGGSIFLERVEHFQIQLSNFTKGVANQYGSDIVAFNSGEMYIQNCQFIDGYTIDRGGSIFLQYIDYVYFENTLFQKNLAYSSGGALDIYAIKKVELNGVNFYYNYAVFMGGAMLIQTCNEVLIYGCTFFQNMAPNGQGAGLYYKNYDTDTITNTFIIKNNTFSSNQAGNGGGLIIKQVSSLDGESVIEGNIFSENQALVGNGGAVYLESILNQLNIINNQFLQNESEESGGALSGNQASLLIENCNFIENFSNMGDGAGINLENECFDVVFQDLIFNQGQAKNGGAFYVTSTTGLSIHNVQISQNIVEKFGGGAFLYNIQDGEIFDLDIYLNEAFSGGGIYCEQLKNVKIYENQIYNNTVLNQGAGMYFQDVQQVFMNQNQIVNNSANIQYGGIYISNIYDSLIQECNIEDNKGALYLGGIYMEHAVNLTLNFCQIVNNFGGGVDITDGEQVYIIQTQIKNNEKQKNYGGGLNLQSCKKIELDQVTLSQNSAVKGGGGIYGRETVSLIIKNSSVLENNGGNQGGGIFLYEVEDFQVQNSIVKGNFASKNGGGIKILSSKNTVLENLEIQQNYVEAEQGGGMYLQENSGNFDLINVSITQNIAVLEGGGIYLNDNEQILIKSSTINENIGVEYGEAIYSVNVDLITLEKTVIQDHNSGQISQGGGLYVTQSEKIIFIESTIKNNSANQQGGGSYFQNVNSLILKQSTFSENQVINLGNFDSDTLFGGNIFFSQGDEINVENSLIQKGYAYMRGGGFYIQDVKNIIFKNNDLKKNQAYLDENQSLYEKTESHTLSQGGNLYIEAENNDFLQITFKNNILEYGKASSGGAAFINANFKEEIDLIFENNEFHDNIADIGSAIRIIGIDLEQNQQEIENLKEQLKKQNASNTELININSKSAHGGMFEYFYNEKVSNASSAQFTLCSKGSYLKKGGEDQCESCLENGVCEGGYIPVYPEDHYWRSSMNSYDFIYCNNNEEACLGNDTCRSGHSGLLCENCDRVNGFSMRTQSQKCHLCNESKGSIIVINFLFLIVIMLVISYQIYGLRQRVNKLLVQKVINTLFSYPLLIQSYISPVIKLLIFHYQVIYLIIEGKITILEVNFDLLGNQQQRFAENMECLYTVDSLDQVKSINLYQQLVSLVILLVIVLVLCGIEYILFCSKKIIKEKQILVEYIKCTFLCFGIIYQPGIYNNAINYITCRKIEGESYSQQDTNIKCWESYFWFPIFPVNLLLVLLAGVIFPLILFLILKNGIKQKRLNSLQFQRKYGILYLEYKNNYGYWEILITCIHNKTSYSITHNTINNLQDQSISEGNQNQNQRLHLNQPAINQTSGYDSKSIINRMNNSSKIDSYLFLKPQELENHEISDMKDLSQNQTIRNENERFYQDDQLQDKISIDQHQEYLDNFQNLKKEEKEKNNQNENENINKTQQGDFEEKEQNLQQQQLLKEAQDKKDIIEKEKKGKNKQIDLDLEESINHELDNNQDYIKRETMGSKISMNIQNKKNLQSEKQIQEQLQQEQQYEQDQDQDQEIVSSENSGKKQLQKQNLDLNQNQQEQQSEEQGKKDQNQDKKQQQKEQEEDKDSDDIQIIDFEDDFNFKNINKQGDQNSEVEFDHF